MSNENNIKISEIFGPTIQGEGVLIGEPCIFVRTAGCDFRCNWCDTMHAVDSSFRHQWHFYTTEEVFAEIEKLSKGKALTVTLSGGNPAIQDFKPLIEMGIAKGYRFSIETQGSIYKNWFDLLDTLVLSPKPPSSLMENDWSIFDKCCTSLAKNIVIKIPVTNEEDYIFSKKVSEKYSNIPFFLQPVNETPPTIEALHNREESPQIDLEAIKNKFIWLVEQCLADQWYNVRILPQLHVLIWGNKGGV